MTLISCVISLRKQDICHSSLFLCGCCGRSYAGAAAKLLIEGNKSQDRRFLARYFVKLKFTNR